VARCPIATELTPAFASCPPAKPLNEDRAPSPMTVAFAFPNAFSPITVELLPFALALEPTASASEPVTDVLYGCALLERIGKSIPATIVSNAFS